MADRGFLSLRREPLAHVDMAQLGPQTWAELHQLADRFQAQVGDSCGCGTTMVHAMRGFHDAVNVHLGKPVQHPEDLAKLAQFVGAAARTVNLRQLMSGELPSYKEVEIEETEEDKRRAAAIQKLFEAALEE